MHPPGADVVLLRHGELAVKSPSVQGTMERQLVENVGAILDDRALPGTVDHRWNRPVIETKSDRVADVAAAASDAFGIVSSSPALALEPDLEAIVEALSRIAPTVYDGGSFAVDAHRAHKDHPFTSTDLERAGGDAIWAAVEDAFEPAVDLEDPDRIFEIEVRRDEAYVFTDRYPGPAGLPVGTQDPLVALVSGGIDSPVAVYETLRRGVPIYPVYVDLGDFGGADHRARALETVRTLNRYVPNHAMSLRIVDGGETVSSLVERMERGRMLSLRRYFFWVGEAIARELDAKGIVTGEAIGQKSSQTASNLAVTSAATELPVHRPLIAIDKQRIVDRAREIGTYEDSTIPAGCNRVVPDEVETRGDLETLLAVEPTDLRQRAIEDASAARIVDPSANQVA